MNHRFKFIMALLAFAVIAPVLPATSKGQENTEYGVGALESGTKTGAYDSAFGYDALNHDTTGGYNTATGVNALIDDTAGSFNTATGVNALFSNTTGMADTANGQGTLTENTSGSYDTAVGSQALHLNTTGTGNAAYGYQALYSCTTDSGVTATGYQALYSDSTLYGSSPSGNTADGYQALFSTAGYGTFNTATGYQALRLNTTGQSSTADGYQALCKATNAFGNTATGCQAMMSDTTGSYSLADGFNALYKNTSGNGNTALGFEALTNNTVGSGNMAAGQATLALNTTGTGNTGSGASALFFNTSGSYNTALGYESGSNLSTGSNNIDIGDYNAAEEQSDDNVGESNTIRIGETDNPTQNACYIAGIENDTVSGGAPVYVTMGGLLGVKSSSRRYKQDIKTMGDASEVLLSLRPVSFKYKPEIDPKGLPQFGLVAEEVEKASPALVVHDKDGKPYTVRYEAVNAMLLNEFLKEHEKVSRMGATIAEQQKVLQGALSQIKSLTASLKEQASLLEKVSAQMQVMKAKPEVVSDGN
jgi:hypothetical protein